MNPDRRDFLKSTALAGAAGATSMADATQAFAETAQSATMADPVPSATVDKRGEPRTRRFSEQRWLINDVIRANGIDWDQPRSLYLSAPCGVEANADFAGIRERVKKMADIGPAFAAVARRREAKAKEAAEAEHKITARDNYFMAAVHWGSAQWPYDQNDETNVAYNAKKRECYGKYAALAAHHVESVWIPFKDRGIPAWFHLPLDYRGGRLPVVIAIPGMDSFKEVSVALYGDRWLNRGIAVLAIDGPGQYEAPLLGVYFSVDNWVAAGPALVNWLAARPEVDAARIGVTGTSFGSFFGTILTANEPRIAACAVMSVCHEPGCHTIFEEASPTFKKRFMYMSGFTDEAAFDAFRRTITWEGHAEKIRVPYLCVAGEADELSPLEHSQRLLAALGGQKQLVVYQESRHSVGNVPAANLGPFPPILVADWMADRLAGKPLTSERWFVAATGQVSKTPI
jgi:dienelactone hydrolase